MRPRPRAPSNLRRIEVPLPQLFQLRARRLKQPDAEMKRADALPKALALSRRLDLIHEPFQVEAVVEDERADRRGDADTGAGGVAQTEGEISKGAERAPQVAGVEEERSLDAAAERNTQLRARVDEGVAAADQDAIHRQEFAVGRA